MQMKSDFHHRILFLFNTNRRLFSTIIQDLFKIYILLKHLIHKEINLLCSSWNGMIFWCHNCNNSPPVNNLVPSKFHDKEVMFDSVCRLPVWTHLYSNCYKKIDKIILNTYLYKCIFNTTIQKYINTNMWTSAVYKWCRLKNAHLIFIRCSNFSCICTTVQTTDSNIIVYSSRNYLDSFKIVG